MHFKDIKLSRRGSPDADSRPGTPAELKTGWRGRTSQHTADSSNKAERSVDPEVAGRQPKRSNSFGLGLGSLSSLANGMSKAGESLSRKSTATGSDGTKTPPTANANSSSGTVQSTTLMGPPALPDSSHLAQFSLKLSELVNRAFIPCAGQSMTSTSSSSGGGLATAAKNAAAMSSMVSYQGVPALTSISYEGKRLPSKPIVIEIAKTVVGELEYAGSVDPYLLRAVSRSALKALTLFADRIDSLLVSPSKDPSALFVPSTAKEGLHLPSALEFNLGLVTLEWIVEDALERCIEGAPGSIDEGMPHFVSEILTPVRKKMEGTILHTIQPVISNVKTSLIQCLAKAVPMPFSGFGQALSPVTSLSSPLPESNPPTPSGVLSPGAPHSSAWLRELEGRLEGCRRLLLTRIEERCGQDGEGWFISVAIHLIWKGLFFLTSRTIPMPHNWASRPTPPGVPALPASVVGSEASKRSPSPAQLTNALKSVTAKPRKLSGIETPSGTSTPSQGAQGSFMTLTKGTLQQLQDLQSFEKLVLKFASGFEPSRPRSKTSSSSAKEGSAAEDSSDEESDDDDEDELARAALAEALLALKNTATIIPYLETHPDAILDAILPFKDRGHASSLPPDVTRAAKATPPLALLHLLYARMPTHLSTFASMGNEDGGRSNAIVPAPPDVFSYSWSGYERAITGFAGGQTWAYALVDAWKEDTEEANKLLEEREKKLGRSQNLTMKQHKLEVPDSSLDPSESTPTPQSVLMLRRTVSARSTSDSSDSIPEEMTASAPTLDRGRELAATISSSPRSSIQQPQPAIGSPRPDGKEGNSPPLLEASPPRSTNPSTGGQINHKANNNEQVKAKRFWRSQSSQGGSTGGFHLGSISRVSTRTASPAGAAISQFDSVSSSSPPLTEEERASEELRMEREGVRLLMEAIRVMDAMRKPRMSEGSAADVVASHT